jgi:hypothetical protein
MYCALFSVLMTGAIVAVMNLTHSNQITRLGSEVVAEADFINQKFDWIFSNVVAVDSFDTKTINVRRQDVDGISLFELSENSGVVYVARGESEPIRLNSDYFLVSDFDIQYENSKLSVQYKIHSSPFIFETYVE